MTLGHLTRAVIPIFLVSVALGLTVLGLLADWLAGDLTDAASEGDGDEDAMAPRHDAKNVGPQSWLKM